MNQAKKHGNAKKSLGRVVVHERMEMHVNTSKTSKS